MKAIILAAGKGTRMGKLTEHIPKPLISVAGKSLLEHKLDILPTSIEEVIIVIGYKADMIEQALGASYKHMKLTYVLDTDLLGTGGSLAKVRHLAGDRFIVIYGDDLYHRADIEECLKHPQAILIKQVNTTGTLSGGKILTAPDGTLLNIIEGTHQAPIAIFTGVIVLSDAFFNYPLVQLKGKNEYGLPQTMVQMIADHPIKTVHAREWLQVGNPTEYEIAVQKLTEKPDLFLI